MRSQILEVGINKQHLVYGIVALVLVAVLGVWSFFGNPIVWKWDGQWHVQKRVTKDYHKFYPEAEQIEYVSATSGGEPVGYDNVSLSKWMGLRCQGAAELFVGLKLMQHVNPVKVVNQLGYTVGSVDEPIRVGAYGVPDKILSNAVPDSVTCTVTFKGHTYSQDIAFNVYSDKTRPVITNQ